MIRVMSYFLIYLQLFYFGGNERRARGITHNRLLNVSLRLAGQSEATSQSERVRGIGGLRALDQTYLISRTRTIRLTLRGRRVYKCVNILGVYLRYPPR